MTSENRAIGGPAHRINSDRRIAGIAVAGLLGAILVPGLGAEAAAAATCEPQDFAASAAADLLTAKLDNLELIGADAPALADVRVAAARSWMNSTTATKSHASVDYLDAELLGEKVPAGPLNASVSQSAPPDNTRPAMARPGGLNAGVLRIGPGPMSAHATWKREYGCRSTPGVIAESYGSDLEAAVLPTLTPKHEHTGSGLLGDSLVSLPANAFSRTATGLVRREGTMTTAASAWTGLTQIVLFGDTDRETTVRVIHPPELTALATGSERTSTVEYTSPVLEITTADGTSRRLEAPGEVFTLTMPPEVSRDPAKHETDSPESAERPELPEDVLPDPDDTPDGTDRGLIGGLLGDLTGSSDDGTGEPKSGEPKSGEPKGSARTPRTGDTPGADDAPGVAEVTGAEDKSSPRSEVKEEGTETAVPELVVRLSLGRVDSRITERSVSAEAASIRLEVSTARGEHSRTLADVGVGRLKVHTTAPRPAPSNPPVTTPPSSGGGGSLPTTGVNVLVVLAVGALLLAAGRLLMVVAKRRTAESPPQ